MIPTRRQALLLLTGLISAMTKDTRAQALQSTTAHVWKLEPVTLVMDMASFKEYKFTHKGETIIITPDEMWSALKGER